MLISKTLQEQFFKHPFYSPRHWTKIVHYLSKLDNVKNRSVLIQAALEAGWWLVAVLIVASSLLAVIYVWRVIEAAYFQAPPEERTTVSEVPLSMLVPLWLLVFANFYFGIDSELTTSAAGLAAETLLGGWK